MVPQLPSPPPRYGHRCGWPLRHTLLVYGSVGAWCWWGLAHTKQMAMALAPGTSPDQMRPLTVLLYLVLTFCGLPLGVVVFRRLGFWHCWALGGGPPALPQAPLTADSRPVPVMVERIYLSPEEAARRGLAGPVIVERIHYPDPRNP